MNALNERITAAQQTANLLASDIAQAYHEAASLPEPPQGRSAADKALTAFLAEQLAAARQLESKLLAISP